MKSNLLRRLFESDTQTDPGSAARKFRSRRFQKSRGMSVEVLEIRTLLSRVHGTVFLDQQADGQKQSTDSGLAGVSVELMGSGVDGLMGSSDDVVFASSVSQSDGRFSFPTVPDGQYALRITDPQGVDPTPSAGFSGLDDRKGAAYGSALTATFTVQSVDVNHDVSLSRKSTLSEIAGLLKIANSFEPEHVASFNYGGRNEKWFRGEVNSFSTRWYFIEPSGRVFEWNGRTNLDGSKLVAALSPEYYANTSLLTNASPSFQTSTSLPQLRFDLDQEFQFSRFGSDLLNWGNAQEKWIVGRRSSFGHDFYFLLPDGGLYAWNGARLTASGQFIANVGTDAYVNPDLLTTALSPESTGSTSERASRLLEERRFIFTGRDFQNWAGTGEKWLWGERHQYGSSWYFISTSGDVFAWNGTTGANGARIASLAPEYHADLSKLYLAPSTAVVDSLAFAATVSTAYGLKFTGKDHFNVGGRQERWLYSERNPFGKNWFFVTPDGGLHAWDGVGAATGKRITTLAPELWQDVARLDSRNLTTVALPADIASVLNETYEFRLAQSDFQARAWKR